MGGRDTRRQRGQGHPLNRPSALFSPAFAALMRQVLWKACLQEISSTTRLQTVRRYWSLPTPPPPFRFCARTSNQAAQRMDMKDDGLRVSGAREASQALERTASS